MIDYYIKKIFNLDRSLKIFFQILADICLILLSFSFAMALRLDTFYFIFDFNFLQLIIILVPFTILLNYKLGIYNNIVRYVSGNFYKVITIAAISSSLLGFLIINFTSIQLPRSVPFIYLMLLVFSTISVRVFIRNSYFYLKFQKRNPVVIYGAGDAGRQLKSLLENNLNYLTVFFIDDNDKLEGKSISGLKIFSFEEGIIQIKKFDIQTIILAMPSISLSRKKILFRKFEKHKLEIKDLPNLDKIIRGDKLLTDFKNISVEDYLDRDKIQPIPKLMYRNIKDKNVLVTGAGGSIGSELSKIILNCKPKTLILIDQSEFAIYNLQSQLVKLNKTNSTKVKYILGSVQNEKFIQNIFKSNKLDTIYHAAAYKHVPIIEENVREAMYNNIFSTLYLSKIAKNYKVKNFILISTDKAVNPSNYMGVTKRISELICQSISMQSKQTNFSIVRFGNVMGSSGSVIPLFKQQIEKGGPVTVTNKNVTRYFMTISEACELVVQAGAMSINADVFILDMGKPIKITNLAKKMISSYGLKPFYNKEKGDIEIIFTGLRKGEKISEELHLSKKIYKTSHPRIFRVKEEACNFEELSKTLEEIKRGCLINDFSLINILLKKSPINYKPT